MSMDNVNTKTKTSQQRDQIMEAAAQEKLLPTAKKMLDSDLHDAVMRFDIQEFVSACQNRGDLDVQPVFFIMANFFTTSLKGEQNFSTEITFAQYSVQCGISQICHTFLNPGTRKHYANNYEPDQTSKQKMERILSKILAFIHDPRSGKKHPLYTARSCIRVVKSTLAFLEENTSEKCHSPDTVRVYPIQLLFSVMKQAKAVVREPKTESDLFDTNNFAYEEGISCAYHDDEERSRHCTQTHVIRWALTFSEYMCGDITIDRITGRHAPSTTDFKSTMDDDDGERSLAPSTAPAQNTSHPQGDTANTDPPDGELGPNTIVHTSCGWLYQGRSLYTGLSSGRR